MSDLISRQAAIDALCNDYCDGHQDCKHYPKCENLKSIQKLPSAQPVRHGKWKQWDSYGFEDTYKCMACGESFVLIEGTPITNGYKYCPSCGANMDAERKEE